MQFNISHNELYAAGGKALADALRGNQVLTELNLATNDLGLVDKDSDAHMSGVIAVSDAIPTMGALTSLDISNNHVGAATVELDAGWEQRFRECVLRFDKDGDRVLSRSELGAFCEALHADKFEVERNIRFFCHGAPEAREAFLQDGDMTVEGLVSFYKRAAKTRASAVMDNLLALRLLSPKAIGVLALADAIRKHGASFLTKSRHRVSSSDFQSIPPRGKRKGKTATFEGKDVRITRAFKNETVDIEWDEPKASGALAKLDASANNMFGKKDKAGVRAWAEALRTSMSITELNLAMNKLSAEDTAVLTAVLSAEGTADACQA